MEQNQNNNGMPPSHSNVNMNTRLVEINHRQTGPMFDGGGSERTTREDDGGDELDRTNLYIKNLPKECTQVDLDDIFKEFGVINQSRVYQDGVGFVRFEESGAAEAAIRSLNGTPIDGNNDPLIVKYAFRKSKSPKRNFGDGNHRGNPRHHHHHNHHQGGHFGDGGHHHSKGPSYGHHRNDARTMKNTNNVYLRGLPKGFSESELLEICEPYGELTCSRLRDTGVAFVRFKNAVDAARAIRELNGRQIGSNREMLLAKLANSDPFQPKMQFPSRDEMDQFQKYKYRENVDSLIESEYRPANRFDYGRGPPPSQAPSQRSQPSQGSYVDSYDRHPYGGGGGGNDGDVGGWGVNGSAKPAEQRPGEAHHTMIAQMSEPLGGPQLTSSQPQQHQQIRPGHDHRSPPTAQRIQSNPLPMPQQQIPFNQVFFDMNGQQYAQFAPAVPLFGASSEFSYRSAPSSISSANVHFVNRAPDVAQMSNMSHAIPSAIVVNPSGPPGNPNGGTSVLSPMSPGGNVLAFNMVRPGSVSSFHSLPSLPSASSGHIFVPSVAGGHFPGMVAPIRTNAQTVGTIATVAANPAMFPVQAQLQPMQPQPMMNQSVNLAAGIGNLTLSQPGDVAPRS